MKKVNLILVGLVTLVALIIGFSSCGGGSSSGRLNSKEQAGYSFVLKRLKSPSSANLIEHGYGDKFKKAVETAIHGTLPSCITVGYYEIEAQNSFGGMVRDSYWVFYRNGVPCHVETSDNIDYAVRSGNPQGAISAALSVNGCDCGN